MMSFWHFGIAGETGVMDLIFSLRKYEIILNSHFHT
jgi:hypothetical protein